MDQIMSVQFGKWNFDRRPVTQEYLDKVGATLAPYGPDSNDRYSKDGVAILYRAFHTTTESHLEVQPHISPSGAVITWDGRLEDRKSTRLNSSHRCSSYAVFCLKKK